MSRVPRELAGQVAATTGFLPVDEGESLYESALSARSGIWMEVGTYCGKSTRLLADAARRTGSSLVTIDHHHGSEENQPGWEWHDRSLVDLRTGRLDTFPHFRPVLDAYEDILTALVAPTQTVASWWQSPLEFLFLDGNHTEAVAQHDYAAFAAHLVCGGLLAVHDVFPDPADGGQPPWHVVQRALGEGFTQIGQHGSLRVLRRG